MLVLFFTSEAWPTAVVMADAMVTVVDSNRKHDPILRRHSSTFSSEIHVTKLYTPRSLWQHTPPTVAFANMETSFTV